MNATEPIAAVVCNAALLEAYHTKCRLADEDPKDFVDCVLKRSPHEVLSAFEAISPDAGDAEYIAFFRDHFSLEEFDDLIEHRPSDYTPRPPRFTEIIPGYPALGKEFAIALKERWLALSRRTSGDEDTATERRSSLIPLPRPFFIAGGRFRECYYWDTYWIIKGLLACDMKDSARNCIENFLHLVKRFGFVPNGNRVYYLNRSQPPLLYKAVDAVFKDEVEPDLTWLANALVMLDREYDSFVTRCSIDQPALRPLCSYQVASTRPRPEAWPSDARLGKSVSKASKGDDTNPGRDSTSLTSEAASAANEMYSHLASCAESGWDFSSRWMSDHTKGRASLRTTDIVPVCLNSILLDMENTLARLHSYIAEVDPDEDDALREDMVEKYESAAEKRTLAINRVLWNKELRFWCDYDMRDGKSTAQIAASGLYPLWAGCWPETWVTENASAFVKDFRSCGLLGPGGIAATTVESGEQWDYPSAWPPLADIAVSGFEALENAFPGCGAEDLAQEIADSTLASMFRGFQEAKVMHEKYDASSTKGRPGGGGEYKPQTGFGWSNGVALDLMRRGFLPRDLTGSR